MNTEVKRLSRRNFLHMVGRAGGAAAVYETMAAMGLMAVPAAYAGPPRLASGSGRGKRIVILGAGIGGMVAAYEMAKAGYECLILEARDRSGGRIRTVRGGDTIYEYAKGSERILSQHAAFDAGEHMYLNVGAARIPNHHEAVLEYCRRFGVRLEPLINDNRAAYFHDSGAFGGKPVPSRQVVHDSRGYISELLAKAVNIGALDESIDELDRERLLGFIRTYGDLDASMKYSGSHRSGLQLPSGFGPGDAVMPLDFAELLSSEFWFYKMHFAEGFEYEATMMQPVGGMDHISAAFAKRVGSMIAYHQEVTGLFNTDDGVRVTYRDRATHEETRTFGDFCICTLPFSVLKDVPNNFGDARKQAIAEMPYSNTVKIGLQAERRFWEIDEGIYGGITWTDQDVTQIWYPSTGYQQRKGILLAAYIWGGAPAAAVGDMSFDARIAHARAAVEAIHPNHGTRLTHGVSRAWDRVPSSKGGYAIWSTDYRNRNRGNLFGPEGRVYFVGEHVSHLRAWMEGAIVSAHNAANMISERVKATGAHLEGRTSA